MQNILLYFLQSIPETIGLITLALVLAKLTLKWDRIFIFSLALAVIIYIIKILPIATGSHLLVTIFLMFVFINLSTHVSAPRSFIVTFGSVVALALLDYLLHAGIILVTGLSIEELMKNQIIWTLIGVFQSLIFIAFALLIGKLRTLDEGAWKK